MRIEHKIYIKKTVQFKIRINASVCTDCVLVFAMVFVTTTVISIITNRIGTLQIEYLKRKCKVGDKDSVKPSIIVILFIIK